MDRPFHTGRGLLLALALCAALAPQARAQDGYITDPIPEQPIQSGLGIELTEFTQLPQSNTYPAPPTDVRLVRRNRINFLGEVPDGSGRLYVPDLNGKLYMIEEGKPREYLDVGEAFKPAFFSQRGLGQGFGFAAFHPEFASNGKLYTVHTEDPSLATRAPDFSQDPTQFHGVITEWTADDPSAKTFSGSHREVLRLGFGTQIHGIQQIDFNPEAKRIGDDADHGLLYLAVGDGGIGARASNHDPQDLAVPFGKVLRIDPLGKNSANGRYGVPASNPFAGRPGALGEVYALGFRDPHRFSWDPAAGHRMFLGHIGEHAIEAVNEVSAGSNHGWSEREGAFVFNRRPVAWCDRIFPLPEDDAKYGYSYPVAAYDHDPPPGWDCRADVGHGIVGGFVYRGNGVPGLRGKYVFADLATGRIFYTEADAMREGMPRAPIHELMVYDDAGRRVNTKRFLNAGGLGDENRVDIRFGRDAEGELYVLSKGSGRIWKITGTHAFAACDVGTTHVVDATEPGDWDPITPSKWRFENREVILAEKGTARPGPRRPFEYAVLRKGPAFENVVIDARVRLDPPFEPGNHDVILVFGHRSDTRFYYAHLSADNTIYPHNGIFVVDDADRLRLDDQWNGPLGNPASGHLGAPPALSDTEWHRVRVVHCADRGEIAVYMDGSRYPLMTAADDTFDSGRVGFGSFDNVGRLRDLRVGGIPRGLIVRRRGESDNTRGR